MIFKNSLLTDSSIANIAIFYNNQWLTPTLPLLKGTTRDRYLNNNILKTKGYHLEHNFGHGKEHLSGFLFTMNILAFLFHTVLDFLDEDYAKARVNLPRAEFFREINVLTKHLYFDSWETLMLFMIRDRDSPKIHASDFI